MRIAIGQLWQETNTFNPLPTTREHFEEFGVLRGGDVVERMASTNELGGFIQSLRDWPEQPQILGLFRLPAWPGGTLTRDTFEWLGKEIVDALRAELPVDAVLLALHGALAAESFPDVEGEVLEAIRQVIGPRVPLVATLDLHANITERMVRRAGALVLYHTVPHIDVFETGQRAAGVLRRILVDGARPVTAFQKLPLVVPAQCANTQDPDSVSYGFRERLQVLEADPRVLCAGLATVQPWLDVPDLGGAVVVVTDGDATLAETLCRELAADLWNRRNDYLPELVPVEEAVREAHENRSGLVVLSDGSDSTTSGAPGDSTWVLRELINHDWRRPALVTMVAPDAVIEAMCRGPGARLTITLGGVLDNRFSEPLTLDVRVERLFAAKFTLSGHLARNLPIDMGPSAVLRHGTGVRILVTSLSGPHFAPELFRLAGQDPFAASVLVAKSPCGFRAAYQEGAKKILLVQAPGCAPADFWLHEYHNIPRPLWPWDEIQDWQPEPLVLPAS
ncbi:MAG: M81 family metallopeptidase [Gemmataceae bacterium]|nr:M81 family metallopeptidase [Gemmataceae bacterium]